MTYKVKVVAYNKREDYHICQFEDGFAKRIDLMVDGSLSGTAPDDLVGKTIEFDQMHAYVSIAHGVKVTEEQTT